MVDQSLSATGAMIRACAVFVFALCAVQAVALDRETPFDSIDGGQLRLAQWSGQPVLVVNTASQCGFTDQFRGLQDLYDSYRDLGLVVLAVPSDDFKLELATDAEVKEFCELQYGIDLPMTTITRITGPQAHPFYVSLRQQNGFVPRWNFNKVLLDKDGSVVVTFGANIDPQSRRMISEIEAVLGQ